MQSHAVIRLEPHVAPGKADLIGRPHVLARRLEEQAGAAGKQQREKHAERAASPQNSFRSQTARVDHSPYVSSPSLRTPIVRRRERSRPSAKP